MKVFIVHAHPEAHSFNSAMKTGAVDYFVRVGHEVQVSDLYDMHWNPVASAVDFGSRQDADYLVYAREQRHGNATGSLLALFSFASAAFSWISMGSAGSSLALLAAASASLCAATSLIPILYRGIVMPLQQARRELERLSIGDLSVNRAALIMAEIAGASQEQRAGIEKVNRAVRAMEDMTHKNAALIEQAAASTHAMRNQVARHSELVDSFRLAET